MTNVLKDIDIEDVGKAIALAAAVYYNPFAAVSVGTAALWGGQVLISAQQKNSLKRKIRRAQAANDALTRRQQWGRSAIPQKTIIYGQQLVSGAPVYIGTSGTNNNRLNYILPLCGHECEHVDTMRVNGDNVYFVRDLHDRNFGPSTTDKYGGAFNAQAHFGTDDQLAEPLLYNDVNDWNMNCRLRGVSYLYWGAGHNANLFSGPPRLSAVVKGKKVIDIRDRSTSRQRVWSQNPALCLYDFLTDGYYGTNLTEDQIDIDSFVAGANRCDQLQISQGQVHRTSDIELVTGTVNSATDKRTDLLRTNSLAINSGDIVTVWDFDIFLPLANGRAETYGDGTFSVFDQITGAKVQLPATLPTNRALIKRGERRYTFNGVIESSSNKRDAVSALLNSMNADLVIVGGKVRLLDADKSYQTPVKTITDFTSGVTQSSSAPTGAFVNAAKGVFLSPFDNWQPKQYDTQPAGVGTTVIDGFARPKTVYADISFENTISKTMAERLALEYIEGQRATNLYSFKTNLANIDLSVGDVINIVIPNTTTPIRVSVEQTNLMYTDKGVELEFLCRQTNISSSLVEKTEVKNDIENIPSRFLYVNPPDSLVLSSGNAELVEGGSGSVLSGIRATWSIPDDSFVDRFVVEWTNGGGTDFVNSQALSRDARTYRINDVDDGLVYRVRVKAITDAGIDSEYATANPHTVIGKSARPPSATGLFIETLPNGGRLVRFNDDTQGNWPNDVRVGGGIDIRFSSDLNADYDDMTRVRGIFRASPITFFDIPAGLYKFSAKLVDSSGNHSVDTNDYIVTLGEQNLGETLVQRSERDVNWSGVRGANTIVFDPDDTEWLISNDSAGSWSRATTSFSATDRQWINTPYRPGTVQYTSQVIDLGSPTTFVGLIDVDFTGTLATTEILYGNTLNGTSIASPTTTTFTNQLSTSAINARYVQVRVRCSPISGTQTNAVIKDVVTQLIGSSITREYTDLNIRTSNADGFSRRGVGNFRLTFPAATTITKVEITPIGPDGTSNTIVSKVNVINKNVAGQTVTTAEFQARDSLGRPSDNGILDITLFGPRRT